MYVCLSDVAREVPGITCSATGCEGKTPPTSKCRRRLSAHVCVSFRHSTGVAKATVSATVDYGVAGDTSISSGCEPHTYVRLFDIARELQKSPEARLLMTAKRRYFVCRRALPHTYVCLFDVAWKLPEPAEARLLVTAKRLLLRMPADAVRTRSVSFRRRAEGARNHL